VASLLKQSVDFLKEDIYEQDYRTTYGEGTPIYDRLSEIYQAVKENPEDPVLVQQAVQGMTALQQEFEEIDCASDIKVSLKPICKNVRASLYLFLHDTTTEINQALKAARNAEQAEQPEQPEQPEIEGIGNAYAAGNADYAEGPVVGGAEERRRADDERIRAARAAFAEQNRESEARGDRALAEVQRLSAAVPPAPE
jgi:hypothetical protein